MDKTEIQSNKIHMGTSKELENRVLMLPVIQLNVASWLAQTLWAKGPLPVLYSSMPGQVCGAVCRQVWVCTGRCVVVCVSSLGLQTSPLLSPLEEHLLHGFQQLGLLLRDRFQTLLYV